jgi:multimeric flavodoxin WrbA
VKIVAIMGSPRPNGNTSILVDAALEGAAEHGCEVEKIILCRYKIEGCRGHDKCSTYDKCKIEDDIPMILEKFRTADGTILATPVYYYNMSAQMKTFIDRNYFLYTHRIPLKSRCMGLIVVAGGEGEDTTIRALRRCFRLKGGNNADNWFDVAGFATSLGEVKTNSNFIKQARELGIKMAQKLSK